MKEYVMPTHAPKKEMPAMMSINTSDPESSGAIFNVFMKKKMSAVRVTKIRDLTSHHHGRVPFKLRRRPTFHASTL